MEFRKAERKKAKLHLAITGAAGSGKTYVALLVAKGFGGKIVLIDTESGSGDLYANELTMTEQYFSSLLSQKIPLSHL